jgi:hypothetical protein
VFGECLYVTLLKQRTIRAGAWVTVEDGKPNEGGSEDGRPFFVFVFVAGSYIHEHA